MNDNKSDDDRYPDYENLLDDLYSLQKNLLPDGEIAAQDSTQLPPSVTDDDVHNLEIPILTEVVDSEISDEQHLKEKFNSAQQHLFEQPSTTQPSTTQPATDEQINAVVTKLMARLRPKIDQILRDKIRTMVVERFNREN
jgi:hypothetical protein